MERAGVFDFNKILAGLLAGAGCMAMILWPAEALASAEEGVALWAATALPALLPFFICANFMITLGVPDLAAKAFHRPFSALFRVPGSGAFIFFISVTSGYPMGAKLIGDLRRRGELTAAEAGRLLAFCSTSGPLFMLGAVGVGMLHSPAAGAVVAAAHYGGALLNGLLWSLGGRDVGGRVGRPAGTGAGAHKLRSSLLDAFTDAILSALKTIGIICCYIIIFTMLVDFMELLGCFRGIRAVWGEGMIKGFLEMTVGCAALAETALPMSTKAILCAFLVSFGGLSVAAQSLSLLSGSGITPGAYLKRKLSHGLLSGFLAWALAAPMLGAAARQAALPASAGEGGLQVFLSQLTDFDPNVLRQLLFSTEMIIIVAVFFALTVFVNERIKKYESRRDHS